MEYGDERFHFQVEFGLLLNVVSSGFLARYVVPGGEQGFTQLGGGGHAGGIALVLVAPLWVFAEGAFHGHRVPENHVIYTAAVGFHSKKGAAQYIGAARPYAYGGDAAPPGHFDGTVLGVEAVDAPELGRDDVSHFVVVDAVVAHAIAVQGEVAVGIHKPRVDPHPGGVHHLLTRGGGKTGSDGRDRSVCHGNVCLDGFGLEGGENDCVFDQHSSTSLCVLKRVYTR